MENYQIERVKFIKEILPLFSENFILKGGTALSLFYGLNRYSEDLDFDCISQNMNFINCLKSHKNFKDWNINIKKDTDVSFKAMIDYGANSHLGNYPLKVEISGRERNRLRLINDEKAFYQKIEGVNVYNIDRLVAMKINAFTGRDKSRDFFDIGFLLENYPNVFNATQLEAIIAKINYFGEEELDLLLLEEIEEHKLIGTDRKIEVDDYAKKILKKSETLLNTLEEEKNLELKEKNNFTRHKRI
ncbi:nucleotidyl transferase AbiEii/AbiGii toxin family protein [Campylobacter sp. US33a]|uniref:nucleotidyl transferase AbiEii/AbiGii toxin family protein n=1 Tax=Campylobacter sp. US33a TaxID=2498120 RepID=UPI001067B5B7|nr:nucleotidyl transferase AbiEii/AbiGii toxin family protein [Campylobacter sp. US33a]TEY00740.1 nucleotidyl transferase AbiEii/AbiGii toxin family protein [Campylobacter sp. US33a]